MKLVTCLSVLLVLPIGIGCSSAPELPEPLDRDAEHCLDSCRPGLGRRLLE